MVSAEVHALVIEDDAVIAMFIEDELQDLRFTSVDIASCRRWLGRKIGMEQPTITIMDAHRVMAVSTVRPDGWPQTTIVGYANAGFDVYFLIFRSSQKFANIRHEPRISLAIAEEPGDLSELQAVYAGAVASEVIEPTELQTAWKLLTERHPNLSGFERPNPSEAVMMRAACKHISILDFTQGFGHTESLTIADNGAVIGGAGGKDDWGSSISKPTDQNS